MGRKAASWKGENPLLLSMFNWLQAGARDNRAKLAFRAHSCQDRKLHE